MKIGLEFQNANEPYWVALAHGGGDSHGLFNMVDLLGQAKIKKTLLWTDMLEDLVIEGKSGNQTTTN